jgi:redox-sensitive bicupin YhaK (pirin superfamily)
MITLRRTTERGHIQRDEQDIRLTFHPENHASEVANSFGFLTALNEIRLPPGETCALDPDTGAELVTYVHRGAFAQEDSTGNSGVIHSGEFQRMTVGRGVHHKETNPSRTDWAHIFRISLQPSEAGLDSAYEQMRYSVAQRHNLLCVIASRDGRKKSLRILQDAVIYSSILDPGHHLIHELLPGRSAWLHVIYGEAVLQDIILTEGDGAGITIEPSASLTAQENTEILLVDVGPIPRPFAVRVGA